jgi:MFS family permease
MKFIRRRPVPPLWLLGLLTFSGPVGMHIFVPALPTAAKDLHATPVALEMTISLYILGLAVGQLLYGPASDRFGRRPALLAGLSLLRLPASPGFSRPTSIRSLSRASSRRSADARGWCWRAR